MWEGFCNCVCIYICGTQIKLILPLYSNKANHNHVKFLYFICITVLGRPKLGYLQSTFLLYMQKINLKGSELNNSTNIPRWYKIGLTDLSPNLYHLVIFMHLWLRDGFCGQSVNFYNPLVFTLIVYSHAYVTVNFHLGPYIMTSAFFPIFWHPLLQVDIS